MHAMPPHRRQPTGKDGRLKEEETNQQDRQADGQRGGMRNAHPLWDCYIADTPLDQRSAKRQVGLILIHVCLYY